MAFFPNYPRYGKCSVRWINSRSHRDPHPAIIIIDSMMHQSDRSMSMGQQLSSLPKRRMIPVMKPVIMYAVAPTITDITILGVPVVKGVRSIPLIVSRGSSVSMPNPI